MQRVLRFAEAWFEPVAEPRLHDWLGKNRELGQNFEAFRSAWEEQREFIGPSEKRRVLHLMALGEEPAPKVMQALKEACAAFFSPLRVAVIRSRPEKAPTPTVGEGASPRPMVSEDLLPWLASGLRSDSVLTAALTLSPLSSCGRGVPGASDWSQRVGVFSLASVVKSEEEVSSQTMERAVKFLLHQVTHMLGILHCCYFRCLMNGAAHQEEADGRPPYLCAMCLKKLHVVTGMDPLLRYMHLSRFWAWAGNPQIALWYETRVRVVRSTFATSQVSLPPTPRLQRPRSKASQRGAESRAESRDEARSDSAKAWWRAKTSPVERPAQDPTEEAEERLEPAKG